MTALALLILSVELSAVLVAHHKRFFLAVDTRTGRFPDLPPRHLKCLVKDLGRFLFMIREQKLISVTRSFVVKSVSQSLKKLILEKTIEY